MTQTTTYVIEVNGRLPAALAAELELSERQENGASTFLTGAVVDSAALYGLLARLESFGVAMVAIHPVPNTSEVH